MGEFGPDGYKIVKVREANAAGLVTGRASVPALPKIQQIAGGDPGRHSITIVNEGTVDIFVNGKRDEGQFRIPAGGERTFGTAGPIYAHVPSGSAVEGFVRWAAETDSV